MKDFLHNTWKHRAHLVMCIPAVLVIFLFSYMPMAGLVMAFKKFNYSLGIWKSPWAGLENFKFLLVSSDTFMRITKNTLLYYLIFTIIGTILNIVIAIGIDQLVFKKVGKLFQSIMIVPVFISYAAVQFIVYAFLSNNGMINGMIQNFGGEGVRWYTTAGYWTIILTVVKIWNSVGYGSVLYMSVLAGIDQEMYEAAQIDGANKWKQICNITLPSLVPMITIMILLSVGGIMRSETGLFYQVTRNSGILYSTTQVIDSYILNAILTTPDYGYTAATTFYQSIVGLLLILGANGIVRKAAPENALF
ncbi:multiple sugar transport system permease protein [Anaerocolumna jejuensis DSM 15929]|uniref:Multiple sugar transport system permease protein n=2 Tax=Anaerocolumna TaxID=1843210 RepID=A0A1M6NTM5_9FIRM|nr:multiple sugar transport system permease protein [Anaerocolumna jejuensis DSM 15929]